MGKLALAYPAAKLSEGEARARALLYADMLGDIPPAILGAAFRKAAQTCRFFPSIAEIRGTARHAMAMQGYILARMKTLALRHDREEARHGQA